MCGRKSGGKADVVESLDPNGSSKMMSTNYFCYVVLMLIITLLRELNEFLLKSAPDVEKHINEKRRKVD